MSTMQIISHGNAVLDLAAICVLGDREEQQDSFGFDLKEAEGIVSVCDGMGGFRGGRLASQWAVNHILAAYQNTYPCMDPPAMLLETIRSADAAITALRDETGQPLRAGSTAVTVLVKDGCLYWNAVGDSRAYLIRNAEFVQITSDQNYRSVLDARLQAGEISQSEYNLEFPRGEALISYLGIGNLRLIDYNITPLKLEQKDKIILMSDGLYKTVTDGEISRIIDNFSDIGEALQALELKARKNAKNYGIRRDNMTAVLIQIK